ncbi:hypothetical protein F2P81_021169 [Scophthalmus maximus]|uniref:Uncharacterized protein n=1 Tax=Scophthalmus maximus TaxID=52904 RepID=A0A6A4S532_SCOMX|nr:hypothetical protein F2P81_021169 [Scophthalmus maximus]
MLTYNNDPRLCDDRHCIRPGADDIEIKDEDLIQRQLQVVFCRAVSRHIQEKAVNGGKIITITHIIEPSL